MAAWIASGSLLSFGNSPFRYGQVYKKKISPLVGTDKKQNVGTDPGSCQKKLGLCSEKFPNIIRKIVGAPDPLIKCQGAYNSVTNVE